MAESLTPARTKGVEGKGGGLDPGLLLEAKSKSVVSSTQTLTCERRLKKCCQLLLGLQL